MSKATKAVSAKRDTRRSGLCPDAVAFADRQKRLAEVQTLKKRAGLKPAPTKGMFSCPKYYGKYSTRNVASVPLAIQT